MVMDQVERTDMVESSGTGFVAGLEDVVAAETRLSSVDGEAGGLVLAGFPVEELAGRASFEETVYLLWHDVLPDSGRLADFREELAGWRELPPATLDLLRAVAAEKVPAMDALRMAAGTVSPGTDKEEAMALVARLPTIVAAYSRMLEGEKPVDPDPELGHALDVVFEIGDASRAEAHLQEKLGRGERLMGFGHRIYRVRDPRADVLAAAAERLYTTDGDRALYELALDVEQTALTLLAEHKPGRNLQTNVEFYTALLLHGLGLPNQLFTPTFAAGRVAGWTAHCFEQRALDRLIRPQSVYVGGRDGSWVPLEER